MNKAATCYELREIMDACPCEKCYRRQAKAVAKPCIFCISSIISAIGKDVPTSKPLSIEAVQR